MTKCQRKVTKRLVVGPPLLLPGSCSCCVAPGEVFIFLRETLRMGRGLIESLQEGPSCSLRIVWLRSVSIAMYWSKEEEIRTMWAGGKRNEILEPSFLGS